jgi:hypothetical protein
MNALLFEGHGTVYLILGVLLVGSLFIYWQTRERKILFVGGIFLGLLGLYYLLDFCVETEQEADRAQIRERVQLMAQAVSQRDPDRLFQHISEKFVSPRGQSRQSTLNFARNVIGNRNVTEIRVWDLHFEDQPNRATGEATIHFQFKVGGNLGGELAFGCAATYEWTGSRGWLLTKVVIFNPVLGREAIEAPF